MRRAKDRTRGGLLLSTAVAIVLSHFYQSSPTALDNHARYAAGQGYRHVVQDASGFSSTEGLKRLHRYECLLHTLNQSAEGTWVLLLSQDAVIFKPSSVEVMMTGRSRLLVRTDHPTLPQVDVQFWQNTSENRDRVLGLIRQFRLEGVQAESEAHAFATMDTHNGLEFIGEGVVAVVPSAAIRELPLGHTPLFALSIDERSFEPTDKRSVPRFREAYIDHINGWQQGRWPLLEFPEYDRWVPPDLPERSVYQPGHSVALTTLYTPNIRSYARMAEHNFRAYAQRHGYTLYIHRDIPAEVGLNASGNWYKPWLLHAYLQHHEWVIWLDADVLFGDLNQALEPRLEGRDHLLAHDLGQWPFNAGVMALRRTPANLAMLEAVMQRIISLDGLNSVYAHDGDQMQFLQVMTDTGWSRDHEISDMIGWNTPWQFRQSDSLTVHYYFMWSTMRALMMARDNEEIFKAG